MEQEQSKINLRDTEKVVCKDCNGELFQEAFQIRKIPGILTGNKFDVIKPIEGFLYCVKCGSGLKEFYPHGFKEENENKINLD